MKLHSPGHSLCGEHINRYACGDRQHAGCSGFSGGYETWMCGCCCHDEQRGMALSDEDRDLIRRVRGAT